MDSVHCILNTTPVSFPEHQKIMQNMRENQRKTDDIRLILQMSDSLGECINKLHHVSEIKILLANPSEYIKWKMSELGE
jgi:hypothetical protein